MSKHTPGPWRLLPHGVIVGGIWHQYPRGKAQSQIAMVTLSNSGAPDPVAEREANARLIAAAPELLEALEDASRTVSHLAFHLRGRLGSSALAELERLGTEWGEVVAKAKGEA